MNFSLFVDYFVVFLGVVASDFFHYVARDICGAFECYVTDD